MVTQPTTRSAGLVDALMLGMVEVGPHRLGYIKGMARACTLFMIIEHVELVGIKLHDAHP